MGHEGLFCTKAEIDTKVGENVDATGYTEAAINAQCLHAESYINIISRHNWSDTFTAPATTSLNADKWYILSELASDLVAMYFITYNMAGYTTRVEAEDMINVLWARSQMLIKLLSDQNTVKWISTA